MVASEADSAHVVLLPICGSSPEAYDCGLGFNNHTRSMGCLNANRIDLKFEKGPYDLGKTVTYAFACDFYSKSCKSITGAYKNVNFPKFRSVIFLPLEYN